MTTIDPAGYSEAGAHLFTWLADKVLGGAKKAFGWGWTQVEWAKAQDRYDARIIKDYGQIRIFGQTAPKSLRDIFTDVYVLDTPTAYRRFAPAALTKHLWNEDRGLSFRHKERRPGQQLLDEGSKFYILGKPGAGKTTFLKHLAVREAQRGKWGPCLGKIPIFVSLKQFGETSQSLFDFIVAEFAVCGFPDAAPFVEALLKSGQALVLFDGLDEASKTEKHDRRGEVTQMLAQFARQYGDCHIVITCRIAAVDYTFEPAFTYLEMADFAPDQVDAFVHAWFWDEIDRDASVALAEGMLAELAKPEHAGIRDLSRNPLLLTLLCLNYAETLSFPARRVEIYEEALDALLKKWDNTRRIQRGGLYKTLSLGRKRQMFARIAFDAMARGEVVMTQPDLERWLVGYLANVPELPPAIDIDGEAVLREIIAQHGIFAEQAHGLFSFAHLTFQEYYSAKYVADNAESVVWSTLVTHMTDHRWREVFLLTASLLPDATTFLRCFEIALHRSIAQRPQVVALLHWIGIKASASQVAVRKTTTRMFYVRALAFAAALVDDAVSDRVFANQFISTSDFDLDFDKDFDFSLTRALARALDIDLALALGSWVADGVGLKIDIDYLTMRKMVDRRELLMEVCHQEERIDLCNAIAAINGFRVRPDETWEQAWRRYTAELQEVIVSHGTKAQYWQLQGEAGVLVEEYGSHGRSLMNLNDLEILLYYVRATRLFYECLQLAYTPDRRAFEDRIFWLPPDLNQQ
jgi:hypothetical protein